MAPGSCSDTKMIESPRRLRSRRRKMEERMSLRVEKRKREGENWRRKDHFINNLIVQLTTTTLSLYSLLARGCPPIFSYQLPRPYPPNNFVTNYNNFATNYNKLYHVPVTSVAITSGLYHTGCTECIIH